MTEFPPPILRLPPGTSAGDAARAAARLARQIRWLDTFRLFVGDHEVGLTSRSSVEARPPAPGDHSPLVPHECHHPGCQTIEYRPTFNRDDMPTCESCGRRMGLVR